MKFKSKESVKKHIDALGLACISKISSINYLARKDIGIDTLVILDAKIKELECGIWSLVPLAMDGHIDHFQSQAEHVKELFNFFIKITDFLKSIKDKS
jgi:hypothetical protein